MAYGLALAVWQTVTLGLYLLAIRAIASPSPRARGEGRDEGAYPLSLDSRRDPLTLASHSRSLGSASLNLKNGVQRTPALSPHAGRGDLLWLLLVLGFPSVLINIGHGQNGFLTAALLGGALVVLDRRPILAGIMIGLLIYKPQYGLMIPIALAVSGRWRAFAAAAATVAVATIATTLVFGVSVWHAFAVFSEFTRT